MLCLFMLACSEGKPQTKAEKKKAQIEQGQKNFERLFLGAVKLCLDTDYTQHFKSPRKVHNSTKGDCCTGFVPMPYINPLEYYYWVFEGDRAIFDNRDNPFELEKIRKQWKNKREKIAEKSMSVDTENLVNENTIWWQVDEYDFASKKLKLTGGNSLQFYAPNGGTNTIRHAIKPLSHSNLSIDMDKADAEKLFDTFEKMKKNLAFPIVKNLSARITYAIRKPQKQVFLGKFDVIIKKVELFYPNDWSKKIGEIEF